MSEHRRRELALVRLMAVVIDVILNTGEDDLDVRIETAKDMIREITRVSRGVTSSSTHCQSGWSTVDHLTFWQRSLPQVRHECPDQRVYDLLVRKKLRFELEGEIPEWLVAKRFVRGALAYIPA